MSFPSPPVSVLPLASPVNWSALRCDQVFDVLQDVACASPPAPDWCCRVGSVEGHGHACRRVGVADGVGSALAVDEVGVEVGGKLIVAGAADDVFDPRRVSLIPVPVALPSAAPSRVMLRAAVSAL